MVKPFVNLTKIPMRDIYAAGLSEEVLAQLARFKEITVFGRARPRKRFTPGASAPEIRRRFGSRYILEGSVRLIRRQAEDHQPRPRRARPAAIIWSDGL